MLHLSAYQRYFLYSGDTNMRKSFDSLSGIVTTLLQQNVLSGDIFIFVNKRRNQIKLLHWEGDGFALYHKRLEKGTYELPANDSNKAGIITTHSELLLILQGITLASVRKRKRYRLISTNV
jgi:transposase